MNVVRQPSANETLAGESQVGRWQLGRWQLAPGQTLPLFNDLEPAPGQTTSARENAVSGPASAAPQAAEPPGAERFNRHLAAAIRLSRSMRRLRDHSPEQTRTGQAIFRHLQALLDDTSRA